MIWRFLRPPARDEVRAELSSHLEHRVRDLVAQGIDPEAARAQALAGLGDLPAMTRRLERLARERNRTLRRRESLGEVRQDLRFAVRHLRRWPVVALVVVLSLGLGISGTVAAFGVVRAVLLAPLPYPEPERLVRINELPEVQGSDRWELSYPAFLDVGARSRSLDRVVAFTGATTNLTLGEETLPVPAATVSVETLGLLGVTPVAGRDFNPEDGAAGAPPVVVVSERLWRRRLGADPGLPGRVLTLDGSPVSVVGIAPAELRYPDDDTEIWLPLGPPAEWMQNRAVHILQVVGRLAPGATVAAAERELDGLLRQIQLDRPGTDPGHGIAVRPLRDSLVGDVRQALLLLFAASGAVLLLVCANVGGVLLTRALRRDHEMTIRRSLGAGPWRIARQLLTESLALAGLGFAVGMGLGTLALRWLVSHSPPGVPRLVDVGVDGSVVLVAALAALGSGVVFGLAPTIHALRGDPALVLRGGQAWLGGPGWQHRLRGSLVVLQVALAQVLLVATGLLALSFARVQRVDPGFDPARLLTLTVAPPASRYTRERVIAFYQDLPDRLLRVPGVAAASVVSRLPLSGGDGMGDLAIEGRPFPPGQSPTASFRRVVPNYFATAGIPLVAGRWFDDRDRGEGDFVVVINESFARRFWPDGGVLGKRIKVGPPENEPWLTIVGVAGDVRNVGLEQAAGLAIYEPHAQRPGATMSVLVRTTGDPLRLAAEVRRAVRWSDPDLPVVNVTSMERRIGDSLAPRRFTVTLVTAYSLLAVLLAMLGVWGVARHSVEEERRELGVRVALGAGPGVILAAILGRTARLAAAGVALGTGLGFTIARIIEHRLFATPAADPAALLGAAALLGSLAIAATIAPAVDGARTDPMRVLRGE
jgi:putative ABC transport system permease protein